MRFTEDYLNRIRMSNDIQEVMSSYTHLKAAGHDWVCNCPFHSEKTPSCHVYIGTQSFFCFGCGAGGDVITFIRRIENLDYVEAVKFLAQRCGMALPDEAEDERSVLRTKILEMNRAAARFYRDILLSPQGKEGLDYFINRGLTPNTIKRYGLGFAPNEWHKLHAFLRSQGYSDDEMEKASLVVRNNNNVYDKFRNRVMFPIIDRRGNVIGFGGRVLDDSKPKYLNSSETMVFLKGSNLFSLNFAKNSKESYFILCEGNMDVIALNQAGFINSVATLGTAITSEQARIIRTYCDTVYIAYDSDEAGQKATVKAINLLNEAGVNAKIISMTGAKDPDEYIKKYGPDGFRRLIEKSNSAIGFELEKLKKGLDLESADGRSEFLRKSARFLSNIENRLDRAVYISEVAEMCKVTTQTIQSYIDEQTRIKMNTEKKQQKEHLLHDVPKRDRINPEAVDYPREVRAEMGIIAYLFHSPDKYPKIKQRLSPDDFPTSFNRRVYECIINRIENGESADFSVIGSEFTPEELGKITAMQKENENLPFTDSRLDDYIQTLSALREKKAKKPVSEMTAQDLLEYSENVKKKKGI